MNIRNETLTTLQGAPAIRSEVDSAESSENHNFGLVSQGDEARFHQDIPMIVEDLLLAKEPGTRGKAWAKLGYRSQRGVERLISCFEQMLEASLCHRVSAG